MPPPEGAAGKRKQCPSFKKKKVLKRRGVLSCPEGEEERLALIKGKIYREKEGLAFCRKGGTFSKGQ